MLPLQDRHVGHILYEYRTPARRKVGGLAAGQTPTYWLLACSHNRLALFVVSSPGDPANCLSP